MQRIQPGGMIIIVMEPSVSIIVPVLNEESILRESLNYMRALGEMELIVSDGDSTDRSMEISQELADTVISSPRGRGTQMNMGAKHARGDILFFVHADSRPPQEAITLIRNTLSKANVGTNNTGVAGVAGAFDIYIDHPSIWFRLIETTANMRSRVTGIPYGDQGLFLWRETFERIDGFRELPIMEDVEIAGRLKQEGNIIFLKERMTASARRWIKEGLLRCTLRDWSIYTGYKLLGITPEKLHRYYKDTR
ncbi:TIGR04283 family arsenosugar biosynthesis glycosyltransferase [Nitrospirota bacterium]